MRALLSRPRHRGGLLAGAAAAALLHGGSALALPVLSATPPQVSAGGAQPIIASGNGAVRVDLNAPRTIIDWTSFNLTASERADFVFDQRSWIVLNRVTGSAINIDGRVFAGQAPNLAAPLPATASGNVWFYSPQGVAFGANARVDVGGLLATSAAPNTGQFLNAGNRNITYTGTGNGGPVNVAAGAQFNATAHIAFAAPRVATAAGSTVTVSDYGSATYLGADTFELQFFPTFNDDLTLFTFIIPNRGAGTANPQALSIAGQTTSGTIYLAAYSRAAVASELINAPGLLTARSSFAEYGQVTITTGRNVILGQPGPGDNAPIANLVPNLTTGGARIGEVNADGNVNIILTGVNYDQAPQGNLTATRVRAGQGLVIGGSIVTIPGGVSAGDAGVNARNAHIVAGRELNIPTITVAGDLFFGSRASTSTFDRVTSGGDVTVRNNQTISGNLLSAAGGLSIQSAVGPINVATVSSGGVLSFTTGGAVNITTLSGATSVTVGSTGSQTYGSVTGGTVALTTAGTITAQTLTGSAVSAASVGAIRVVSATGTTSVAAGSNTSIDFGSVTAPSFTATSLLVRLGTVSVSGDALVRTPQMDLTNSFTAAHLNIEGSGGVFRLGGDGPLGLTNAELQRITVTGALNLYAGQTVPTTGNPDPVYGDFEVLDVTVDATRIPRLNLFAHSGRQVSVTGRVNVTGSGGVLRIGDAANADWRPDRIVITGALGSASGDALSGYTDVRGFQSVELNATNDILIGSSRFIELVDDAPPETIDLARGLPTGVAAEGDEVGRLFLVAGRARLAAGQRILQQNTGPLGQEAGLYLSGVGVDPTAPLLTLAGGGRVDLFGALADETGVVSGRQASFSRRIAIDGDATLFSGRLNGCPLGIGCAVSTPADYFRLDRFRPAAPAAAIDPPVLTFALPGIDDDEREADPVITGAGNEEIWRPRE